MKIFFAVTLLLACALYTSAFTNNGLTPSLQKYETTTALKKESLGYAMKTKTVNFAFGGDPNNKITRENEENGAFISEFEKKTAADKFKDPILLVGLFSILSPFILFVIFYASGLIGF